MPTDIVERFAERLKETRTRKNLTQVALSEKIGIQTTYLSDLENAKKEPCLRVLDMLATGLGVSMSDLFKNI
ncbi:MAG TPA: helix-turn-helix transcriptional regulator [Candidatus Angelobacter sp.]|jgi:transcriptional regulator with XRE-family HTH domain